MSEEKDRPVTFDVDLRALLTRVRALAHKQVTSGDAYERINEIREALDLPTGWTRR